MPSLYREEECDGLALSATLDGHQWFHNNHTTVDHIGLNGPTPAQGADGYGQVYGWNGPTRGLDGFAQTHNVEPGMSCQDPNIGERHHGVFNTPTLPRGYGDVNNQVGAFNRENNSSTYVHPPDIFNNDAASYSNTTYPRSPEGVYFESDQDLGLGWDPAPYRLSGDFVFRAKETPGGAFSPGFDFDLIEVDDAVGAPDEVPPETSLKSVDTLTTNKNGTRHGEHETPSTLRARQSLIQNVLSRYFGRRHLEMHHRGLWLHHRQDVE